MSRPYRGRRPPDGAPLSASALAFIYRRAFHGDPPAYLVESVLNEFGGLPIRAESVDQSVKDQELRERLRAAYFESVPNDPIWEPEAWQLFRWAVHAGAHGEASAISRARRDGREAWQEVDRQYRSEMASSIPANWEELKDHLQFPEKDGDLDYDIHQWADYFGASTSCVCGTELVDVDSADGFVRHFRLRGRRADEARELIVQEVIGSGVEDTTGGLCSHCWHVLHKDD